MVLYPAASNRVSSSREREFVASQDYVGPFRLLNKIREGKTCEVWEVMNDLTRARVAIKLLAGEAAKNRVEVAFLKHEHRVGQKLDHPQVVKIHEFGTDHDNVYLAMELFAAPNLKQWINQGIEALAPLASECIRKAAEGLSYFHSQGWIHRDIKPDNFLMKPNGDVKLIDFALAVRPKRGLARLLASKSKIQGTRSYMSPEQIRGQLLDERADIYSFGCMIYELIGGKPPYTGTSTNDLLTKHLRAAIPPLQGANRNVSDDFAQLVRRTLAKTPAERPDSMTEFLHEFRAMRVFKVPPAAVR
ncbi:MAG: serine/threonine protein kinase [Planctomycetia bacterium]|nr:serine/threonine protein kinase [Planctomycetia bacterium]